MPELRAPAVPRRFMRNRFLAIGSALLLVFAALALSGSAVAPYDPTSQDLTTLLEPPSFAHWFGTDEVGRDIFARLIAGTRITMMIALMPVALAGLIGVTVGAFAGYLGGRVDRVLSALIELVMTIPGLVLAIAIVAVVGASALGLVAAITVSSAPPLARLIQARVRELRQEDYVSAAIVLGLKLPRILFLHVLPNAASVIVIQLSLLAGQAVLIGSALGFLGLGVQPPAPEWGSMLGASRQYIEIAPHVVIAPGLAIALLVFAFNMLGDGLRDRFDPNLSD
ncbi:peptide/nickel transport system permease protein [Rhizobiales bacterium GAS191]|nr:peptide/nickel transport system permease protein [Rhizobiales bacterium GAS191]